MYLILENEASVKINVKLLKSVRQTDMDNDNTDICCKIVEVTVLCHVLVQC